MRATPTPQRRPTYVRVCCEPEMAERVAGCGLAGPGFFRPSHGRRVCERECSLLRAHVFSAVLFDVPVVFWEGQLSFVQTQPLRLAAEGDHLHNS